MLEEKSGAFLSEENSHQDYSESGLPLSSASSSVSSFNQKQKAAIIFLGCVAIFAIFGAFWQFRNRLTQPFSYNGPVATTTTSILDLCNGEACRGTVTSLVDTDGDGLSDKDETEIYGTSPYIDDSDSDGIRDDEEVKNGTDPLCAQGKNCFNSETLLSASSTSGQTLKLSNVDKSQEETLNKILQGNGDAASIRSLMIEGGMNKEDLDKLNDEELLKIYQEVLTQQASSTTDQTTGLIEQ